MDYRKVTRHVAAEDGTRIAYHTHLGPDPDVTSPEALRDRPAVLLTSGIGTTSNFWRHLIARLSTDHRVVHWDYRGHGESERSRSGDYSMQIQAADLARVTHEVIAAGDGKTPPMHVAFSMGVAVLLESYRLAPELFGPLVLIAGAAEAPGTGTLPFRVPGAMRALRTALDVLTPAVPYLAPAVHRVLASKAVYPAGRLTGVLRKRAPREDIDHFMRELCRMDPLAFWETLRGLMRVDARDVLPKVRGPVLIVAPAYDLMLPVSQVERLKSALPQAEYLRVDDAGHAGLLEAGSEVAEAVRGFFSRARGA